MVRIIFLCLVCASAFCHQNVMVGRDPSWYPHNFQEQTVCINSFCDTLFQAIQDEQIQWQLFDTNYHQLFSSVSYGWDAVLCVAPLNEQELIYSDPIVPVGYVLVASSHHKLHSLDQLNGKIIAVLDDTSTLLVQKILGVIINTYQQPVEAIQALLSGSVDAVALPFTQAQVWAVKMYSNKLTILPISLDKQAIRLATLPSQIKIVDSFNQRLQKIKESSDYGSYLEKCILSK